MVGSSDLADSARKAHTGAEASVRTPPPGEAPAPSEAKARKGQRYRRKATKEKTPKEKTPPQDGTMRCEQGQLGAVNPSPHARPARSATKASASKMAPSVSGSTSTLQKKANERKLQAVECLERERQQREQEIEDTAEKWRREYNERLQTILRCDFSASGSTGADMSDREEDWGANESRRQQYSRPSLRRSPAEPARRPPVSSTAIRMTNDAEFVDSWGDTVNEFQLSRSQVAARHAVPKELPAFSGEPEQWPNFLSNFNRSTRMCGFSADENIMRLERSLRGKAYETVRSLLLHPDNVGKVMATLKMRFGQPLLIVHSLTEKMGRLPPVREGHWDELIDFAVAVQNCVATIEICGAPEHCFNTTLLHQLLGKLPISVQQMWAMQTPGEQLNLSSFSQWLYTIAETFSPLSWAQCKYRQSEQKTDSRAAHPSPGSGRVSSSTPTPSVYPCAACGGECRAVDRCSRFINMDIGKRRQIARENHLCFICLRRHKGACGARPCGSEGCADPHHALLHRGAEPTTTTRSEPSAAAEEHGAVLCIQSGKERDASNASPQFRYHSVVVHGKTGPIKAVAFVDEGSAFTLLEEGLAKALGLEGPNQPLHLQWTGGVTRVEKRSRTVSLKISGTPRGHQYTLTGVRTVEKLNLPEQSLDGKALQANYQHLRGLQLESYTNARPKLLIGIGHLQVGLVLKCREGAANSPVAVKSRLGWTVCGGTKRQEVVAVQVRGDDGRKADEDMHQALKMYFSLDSLGVTKTAKVMATEDARCLEMLADRTRLVGDRYETGLLWCQDGLTLPDSRPMALQRLRQLQKRMNRNPELMGTMKEKIKEYVEKQYIRRLSTSEEQQAGPRRWYLPIFVVTNQNKPGKVRLVWDAAAEVRGTSLNSMLLTGPDLLSSLFEVLIRFREGRIGISGDIREMFHQVRIRREDQPSQLFLWENDHGEIVTYAMQVMTFGARCSPSTAQYVKNINARRFAETHPAAVKAIIHAHYVDDMLASVDCEEDAIQLAKDVAYVHQGGGFEIRGWISNSPRVLSALHGQPDDKCIEAQQCAPAVHAEKVLGMWWDTECDAFTYRIGRTKYSPDLLEGKRCPTKREVLSILMSVFDPLGLLAHFLAYLKILLQKIWRSGVVWDEPIEQDAFACWTRWLKVLPEVESVRIPRWFGTSVATRTDDPELHVFTDASEDGAAAACYIRHTTDGVAQCSLVAAKTRVAPLRFTSSPRMELEAAVLGARLCRSVEVAFRRGENDEDETAGKSESPNRFFWTDSRNVLGWIHSDSRRYSQHVGQRIGEILNTSECREWRWVPSKLNPADDATKWTKAPDLSRHSRWFRGPQFLWESVEMWPAQPEEKQETEVELRPSFAPHHSTNVLHSQQLGFDVTEFSDWKMLLRVVGRILRWAQNYKARHSRGEIDVGPITVDEMDVAHRLMVSQAQTETFREEIEFLKNAETSDARTTAIPRQSSIYPLSPFLDAKGILRMRTRIAACHYATEGAKRPIILPRRHHVTELIVRDFHVRFHHRNHETVINEVRQLYHVPHLRACYSRVRKNCQRCKNEAATPQAPIMADLPPARIAAYVRPFTYVGVDYFGPIEVAVGRRVEKRWGMLATCLTVRAVHIELVHSLTASSCIMGLRNLIARRGTPHTIHCDRGTNFVGAQRELLRHPEQAACGELVKECSQRGIRWEFNPPQASHMGGSWERLIRTVKDNIVAASSVKRLNDEVLRSLLTEIEGIMNARPLTHVPVDDDSAPALTPNHFLLGSSNGTKQPGELDDNGSLLRQNWKTSQVLANTFWKRWLTDYLPEITRRTKWHRYSEPIKPGDVVVIADPKLPRNSWPKGMVDRVFVSERDGQVRSASVRTMNGTYVRPVTKLAVLDVKPLNSE